MRITVLKPASVSAWHSLFILLCLPFLVDLGVTRWGLRCFEPEYPTAETGVVLPAGLPMASIGRSGVLRLSLPDEMALPVTTSSEVVSFFKHNLVGRVRAVEIRAPRDLPYDRIQSLLVAMRKGGVTKVYFYVEL